jgi:MFS family permease
VTAGRLVPRVLREEPRFALLFGGRTVSALGDGMLPVALAFAVLDGLGTATDLGLILTARVVPMVALLLVGGVWGDRISRRRIMIGADLVRFAVHAVMAGLLIAGTAQIWELAALQAVAGAATAFFSPASTGLVPQTVEPVNLQPANALLGLSLSAGSIVGPALAGVLVASVGPGWAVAGDAVSFLLSAAFLVRLPRDVGALPAHGRDFAGELAHGWREFTARTWLWVIVLDFSLFHLAVLGPYLVLGPVVAKAHLGGASAWAAILASSGVGSLAGGLLALRIRPKAPLRVAMLSVFLWGPPLALLAVAAPTWAVAVAAFAAGSGVAVFGALWDTALQEHVPADALSRVSAYDWLGSIVFLPLGLAIAGPAADLIGVERTLWLSVAVLVVSTAATLAVPDIRRVRTFVSP